jgi:hypothetical protein
MILNLVIKCIYSGVMIEKNITEGVIIKKVINITRSC